MCFPAQVVKLVDTPDLGSGAARCGGSSPLLGNIAGNNPIVWVQIPALADCQSTSQHPTIAFYLL